ncbi:hypothetical protein EF906_25705, partial [Streptomyces sp. WAC08241]
MSFGGPQWPQEPQQQGQQGYGGQPGYGPYGQQGYGQGQGPGHGPQPGGDPFPGARDGGSGGPTPDWSALADASASRDRRRRRLMTGGGVLATLAVGAIVATAVVATGEKDDTAKNGGTPTASASPTEAPTPEPT